MTDSARIYDVVVIGGGVVGSAVYFRAAVSSNIKNALLLEKYHAVAQVNSNVLANAETLHRGDKETNFDLPKALKMKKLSGQLLEYLKERGHGVYLEIPSMVIGVGKREVELLKARFEMLKSHYPELQLIGWRDIAAIEPNVVQGRTPEELENLSALYSTGYAVDYAELAQSFVREAEKEARERGKHFQVFFRTKVLDIRRAEDGPYDVLTNRGVFRARTLVVCAGPYSLIFAKRLGLPEAKHFAILPVAGSFYYTTEKFLSGKVYTPQEGHIPFAAPHADRAVYNENETRLGPTAIVLPFFERYHLSTILDFIKMGIISPWQYLASLGRVLSDRKLLRFEIKNILYNLPWLGKLFFLKWAARKIIPTIKYGDLHFGKGMGGIRPQLVHLKEKRLIMGIGKFVGDPGHPVICNVTPSPGASSSLGNAIEDIELIESFLDKMREH